jgi:hypothetical protein
MTSELSFGDNVRVRSAPSTVALGVAGATGQIQGVTMPSSTGVPVVGDASGDCAFAVQCEGRDDVLWFSPDLLEFVDHGAGTEIRLHEIDKKWTRSSDGSWIEASTTATPRKRPWWRFW